ncbi:MAG: cupin domain-containing protein [Anaerolineae bacterium]
MDGQSVPDWIGNTPFPPDEKPPALITDEMVVSFLYGYIGTQVENRVYASTDKIFMAEWILPPGSRYEPPGLHLHGDECYYIVEGGCIAFNPETGETFPLHQDDALLIPQGTRHQIFNFSAGRVVAIACVAPRIWAEDGMGTVIPPVEHPRFYKGAPPARNPHSDRPPSPPLFTGKRNLDSLGRWPAAGPELRAALQLTPIRPSDQLALIHGEDRHVLFSFVVSNDYMHLALLTVPVAGASELESHRGDEVLAVLEGELVIRIPQPDEDPADATYASHLAQEGRKFLIPEGVPHQYLNFTNRPVRAYVAVGPEL